MLFYSVSRFFESPHCFPTLVFIFFFDVNFYLRRLERVQHLEDAFFRSNDASTLYHVTAIFTDEGGSF